jgi:hypothetical protein
VSGLDDLLRRLDADDDDPDLVDAVRRALAALTGGFADLAVVRGGWLRVALLRGPTGARVLVAPDATAADHAALLGGLRRGDRALALAGELLGLALALPHGRLRGLGGRARRIAELGAALAQADDATAEVSSGR